jgi:DNA-binding beta-propeller fold protein YncE
MLFVADTNNNRIQKFNTGGSFVDSWGSFGDGQGQFDNPVSVAVDSHSGYVFVTHGGSKRIQVFDRDGKYIDSWGDTGTGNGQFKRPVSVAFGPDDKLYVTDKEKSEIQIFKISHDNQADRQKIVTVKTTKKSTQSGVDDSSEKHQDSGRSDETGKIKVTFGDVSGFRGTAKVTIKNLNTGKTIASGLIDFGKQYDDDNCCAKTFEFKWDGNDVGDEIEGKAIGGGGSWVSGPYNLKKGTTSIGITVDEIGE